MGALLLLSTVTVEAAPGGIAVLDVRVRNTGHVVDQFAIDVLGAAAGWAAAEPPSLSLFPGQEGACRVRFAPPRTPSVAPGSVPFGIRVTPHEHPDESSVEEGDLVVGSFTEARAELLPRNSSGTGAVTAEVAVENGGNQPIEATLEARDTDLLLDFVLEPARLSVAPGKTARSKLRVTPKQRFWRGAQQMKPFTVTVKTAEPRPLTLDGSLRQTARLPGWVGALVTAAPGFVLAAVAVAVLVMQPWKSPGATPAASLAAAATPTATATAAEVATSTAAPSVAGPTAMPTFQVFVVNPSFIIAVFPIAHLHVTSVPPGATVRVGIQCVNGIIEADTTGRIAGVTDETIGLYADDVAVCDTSSGLHVQVTMPGYYPSLFTINLGPGGKLESGKTYEIAFPPLGHI